MALQKLRRTENAAGDFYVDDTCIDCDLCRQIAPESFSRIGEQSAVHHQPQDEGQVFSALKALVTCPTASIGALHRHEAMKAAVNAFPEAIEDGVYFCGYAAESSYGASSYLVVRPEGNVLVDCPRFARPLSRNIEDLGGVRWIFLTHRDDVADHRQWARHFQARRIMHEADIGYGTSGEIEKVIRGSAPVRLDADLLAVPTPGHTRGHMVLFYHDRFLFAGDHLRWSEEHEGLYASRSVCWYSWSCQIESVERLLDHPFEWILPGHGRRAHRSAGEMRDHLHRCVRRMRVECGE